MAIFVETIVARTDGKIVTTRQQARSLEVAYRLAHVWANGFEPVESECWCATCAPIIENDFGERMTVQVAEYSSEARVKTGVSID